MRILFLPGSKTSPSARFRIYQFVEPLRKLGQQVVVRSLFPERDRNLSLSRSLEKPSAWISAILRFISAFWITRDIERFDVVMMNRDILPSIRIQFIEPWLSRRNPRLIFDFDDAIHLGARNAKLKKILPYFAFITPGNPYLAEFAANYNKNIRILPTVVDSEIYHPIKERITGPIRIGWSGSRSTLQYCLPLLENVLCQLAGQVDFEFIIIADIPPSINWKNVKTRYIPWSANTEVQGLQQIDIGLMPLSDSPFERGKCGLKAIQYMGVGIPALVSPVGVNKDIVIHKETGFHCVTDEEWITYIKLLMDNEQLRQTMGRKGRTRMEEKYSIQSQLPNFMDVFSKVLSR